MAISTIMIIVLTLSVAMQSVVMPSVVVLSVAAPNGGFKTHSPNSSTDIPGTWTINHFTPVTYASA